MESELIPVWSEGGRGDAPWPQRSRDAGDAPKIEVRGDERKRERKGGAFWRWTGGASGSVIGGASTDARFSLGAAFGDIGEGRILRGLCKVVIALGLSKQASALFFGLAVALASGIAFGLFRWQSHRQDAGSQAWPLRPAEGASGLARLAHEGLVGAIPGIYTLRAKPPDTNLLVSKPEDFDLLPDEKVPAGEKAAGAAVLAAQVAAPAVPDLRGLLQASVAPPALADPALRLLALKSFVNESRAGGMPASARAAVESLRALRDAAASPPSAGRLDSLRRRSPRPSSLLRRAGGLASSGAMGQLKLAKTLSFTGAHASSIEARSAYATSAFEQQGPGTSGPGIDLKGMGPAAMPGGSSIGGSGIGPGALASDYGEPILPEPYVPDVGPPINATPYQPKVDQAKDLSDQARQDHNGGLMQLLLGLAMIAAGIAILIWATSLPDPARLAIGIALIAGGSMAVMQGMMQMSQGKQKAEQAKQMGDSVDRDYGQKKQADIIRCDAEAAKSGKRCARP